MKKSAIYVLIAILVVTIASALVVNYMSNTATADVEVTSPMSVQFAEVEHGSSVSETIDIVEAEDTWFDDLTLTGTTGLGTIELGIKLENLADVKIQDKYLHITVENDLMNVDCDDLSSLTFVDVGASAGTTYYQVVQELTGMGLCSDEGTYVSYFIPITSLAENTVYKYPVTMTFGLVAPSDYSFSATIINELPV